MRKLFAIPLVLLPALLAGARDKQEGWLKIGSQHFTVITDSNEKTGRRLADQFERMRAVFHAAFPKVSIDNGSPVLVLAVKDEKGFRTLEPQAYLAKGQLKLGGLFLRAPDKNYILMRLDAEGDHPYAVIYHEYTHFLSSKSAEYLPLWLNEGLAEFYENTDIHEKDVALGQPSEGNLELLRENRLLPLSTLFVEDASSPYYHEENKGSIFYAESWALTHYLFVNDTKEKTHRLADYAGLLVKKVDAVTAATQAFGDLKQLQSNLEGYIRQASFNYFKMPSPPDANGTVSKVEPLSATQADALRADFLAYNGRVDDARSLLDHVLQEDPKNVSAHETMGFLEFQQKRIDVARKWYEDAVKLDSQSYIANYYYATISMNAGVKSEDAAQVESSLRVAITVNPLFAPAYDRLAAFEGMRHQNLDEARMMALKATELEPDNSGYWITGANILLAMDRPKDAVAVLRGAMKVAKSPEESAMIQSEIMHIEEYRIAQEQHRRSVAEANVTAQADAEIAADVGIAREEEIPKGPHHFLSGTLQDVQCHSQSIDMAITAKGKTTALHSGNYYKIAFSAFGFTPKGDLNPCQDLDGTPAKVEYVEPSDKAAALYVVSVELHK